MNKTLKWGASIMLALATLAATPAMARDDRGRHGYSQRDHDRGDRRHDRRHDSRHDRRDDRRHARRDGYYDSRGHRGDRRHDRRYDHRAPVRVVHHRPVVRHVYHPSRHVGPPRWARGGYVHQYHRPTYVVRDYRGYGLRHPPRGHHWVRDDYGDYLLIAVATGLIADLILRN